MGGRGPQGPAGKNSISNLSQAIQIPCVGDPPYTIHVTDTSWMSAGMLIFLPGAGTFTVIGAPLDLNTVQIQNSGDPANTPCGTMLGAGTSVSAANLRGPAGAQGIAGPSGPPGPQGVAGASVFSVLAQPFTVPAVGAVATAFVQDSSPFSAGQIVYVEAGDYFSVQSTNDTNNSLTLVNQGYPGGAPQGTVLPVGNNVSATGPQGPMGNVGPAGPAGPQGLMGVAPTGAIFMWPTPTAPGGYLVCDGSSVAISAFPNLYAVISNTFGAVDGAHFNLPPFSNGVFPTGAGASYPLASKAGAATVTLTAAQIPAHPHPITDLAHSHTATVNESPHTHTVPYKSNTQLIESGGGTNVSDPGAPLTANTGAAKTNLTVGISASGTGLTTTQNNTGGGGAHENRPPYLAINFIIKT
jgi:microcystin-dependent protein